MLPKWSNVETKTLQVANANQTNHYHGNQTRYMHVYRVFTHLFKKK